MRQDACFSLNRPWRWCRNKIKSQRQDWTLLGIILTPCNFWFGPAHSWISIQARVELLWTPCGHAEATIIYILITPSTRNQIDNAGEIIIKMVTTLEKLFDIFLSYFVDLKIIFIYFHSITTIVVNIIFHNLT